MEIFITVLYTSIYQIYGVFCCQIPQFLSVNNRDSYILSLFINYYHIILYRVYILYFPIRWIRTYNFSGDKYWLHRMYDHDCPFNWWKETKYMNLYCLLIETLSLAIMFCLRRSKASDYPFDIFKLIDNSILNQKKPDLMSNGNIHNRLVYFHLSNIWGFLQNVWICIVYC
jgi:hypothetical protein